MSTKSEQWRDEIVALLPRLRRFSFALAGSAADADDLLQATVERALLKYDQFKQGTGLDKWMFRMCKNIWIDEWRSRRVRGPIVDPMDFKSEIGVDGEQLLVNKLALSEVNMAMNRLQDEQKMILGLIVIEGYSYRETAELLDIPVGTVMSRLARARKALAAMLTAQAKTPRHEISTQDKYGPDKNGVNKYRMNEGASNDHD